MTFTPEVYAEIREGAILSAERVVPVLWGLVKPETVIDVGGGEGWWARKFVQYGSLAWVVDESAEPGMRDGVLFDRKDLTVADLDPGDEPFDLALCLEVAEHLPPSSAAGFVDALCRLAPVVAFSAAVPGQGGHGHLNEQWPSYWASLFYENGYVVSEELRWELWDDDSVEPWYRQNLLLAARYEWFDEQGIEFTRYPRSVVHPVIWEHRRQP